MLLGLWMEENGIDRWETESAAYLKRHLITKGESETEAHRKSRYIIKDEIEVPDIRLLPTEYIIFQSADCLDIMRPCCGIGLARFARQYLSFLNNKCPLADSIPQSYRLAIRDAFIQELWQFIQVTEMLKNNPEFQKSEGFINRLLTIVNQNPQWRILNTYFASQS